MTAVLMQAPETAATRPPFLSPRAFWTLVGASAVPMWATWPLFASLSAASMPLFQYLALLFTVGSTTLLLFRRLVPAASDPRPRAGSGLRGSALAGMVMVTFGILGSDIFFLLAIRRIPAAEANLLLYTWPLMVVALASLFRLLRLKGLHLIALGLGITGAALVIGARPENLSLLGGLLAMSGGAVWAACVVFRMWQGENAPDALVPGFALSAVICLVLHLGFEPTVMPDLTSLFFAVLVGILSLALGNLAWDLGARRGDKVVLATFAYATPLCSTLILTLAGIAQPGIGLVVGGGMIVLGGYLSSRAR